MRGDRPQGTKLLVATLGLATVSYVGCGNSHPPGNLMNTPPGPTDTVTTATSSPEEHPPGNLMAPPDPQPSTSATTSASAQPTIGQPPLDFPHGNLMAPPPPPPASAKPKK